MLDRLILPVPFDTPFLCEKSNLVGDAWPPWLHRTASFLGRPKKGNGIKGIEITFLRDLGSGKTMLFLFLHARVLGKT